MTAFLSNHKLIRHISESCDIPQREVRKILSCLVDYVTDELMYGEAVELRGLGLLLQSERAERKARDLHTGKQIIVPARRVVRFRTSRALARKMKNEN